MSEGKPFKPPYTLGTIEDIPGERYYVIGGDGVLFARIPMIDARMKETAEFIIRAVNCHDALVEICKRLAFILKTQPKPQLGDWNWPQLTEELEALIARAESR